MPDCTNCPLYVNKKCTFNLTKLHSQIEYYEKFAGRNLNIPKDCDNFLILHDRKKQLESIKEEMISEKKKLFKILNNFN